MFCHLLPADNRPLITGNGPLMDLLLLEAGKGTVGGMIPCPIHFIALTQVALNRWLAALLDYPGLVKHLNKVHGGLK